MKGKTNSGGNDIFAAQNAILRIRCPAGSTVAFSKSNVTAKVLPPEYGVIDDNDPSLANYYYSISPNNYGTWTVAITTQSAETKSLNITVDSGKEYDVVIVPDLILVPDGNTALTFTRHNGSYAKNNNTWISISESEMRITGTGRTATTGQGAYNLCYSSAFDLTYYKRIVVQGTSWSYQVGNTSTNIQAGICTEANKTANTNYAVAIIAHGSNVTNGAKAISVDADISSLTGLYVLKATISTFNSSYNANGSATITKFIFSID